MFHVSEQFLKTNFQSVCHVQKMLFVNKNWAGFIVICKVNKIIMAKSLLGFLSLVSSIMFNDNPPFVRVQFVKKIKYIWYKMICEFDDSCIEFEKTWN